jgi:hypothetical protein
MSQRSAITRHNSVVLAVVASVGMLGIAPAHATTPSAVGVVPAAPVIRLATAETAQAQTAAAEARWTAPINDAAITKYHVRMVDAATGTKAIALRDVAAPINSLRFTGLAGGVAVRFQVQAISAGGISSASALSNAVTPRTRPVAPKISTATAGVGSAMGRWTARSSGGSAITKYHVRMVDGATGTKALVLRDIAGNLTSLNITGLAKGTSVRFQVQAINVLGTGPVSAHSNAVTTR